MRKLTFKHDKLKELLLAAEVAWLKGVRTLHDEETGPGFWLVGDHGVYLMHNGVFGEGEKPPVVYADECDPTTMEFDDWWEAKRATFGGDDGVDFIDLPTIQHIVERNADLLLVFQGDELVAYSSEVKKTLQ
jgi:hypothetical protein